MRNIIQTSILVATLAFTNTFAAEDTVGQITAKVSTMGLGVEYTYPINSVVSIGIGANKFSKDRNTTKSGIDYKSELDFKSISVIGNYHPWSNGFRLRAGVYYNKNEMMLGANYVAVAGDTIGDTDFNGATIDIDGVLDFKSLAPYVGVGYGSEPFGDNNLSLNIDIGIMRSPINARLSGSCTGIVICTNGTFNNELAKEENELKDLVDELDLYPIVSLGLTYRF